MKILVGISGGVDSAYTAKKLIDQGHDVEGAVLIMHEYTELDAAREAAESVGIRLHEIDCRTPFDQVKENFATEYIKGRTPNPCIICNEKVKFKYLYDFAMENGFDAIATGHYAKIAQVQDGNECRYTLSIAEDTKKDQTYMLYRIGQDVLSRLILPLYEGTKAQIREKAEEQGISAAKRSDSQEICFLPDGNYPEYIESVMGKCEKGSFIDEKGNTLGEHKGIIHYTVGQRKGLGIALGERVFVTDINAEDNTVTLSKEYPGKQIVKITDMVYSGMTEPTAQSSIRAKVKLRYSAPLVDCEARLYPDKTAEIILDEPQRFSPGQSAVLYLNDCVICGGFIQ